MEELNAITRKEKFLAKAAGQDVETPEPITREEMFLSKIAGTGGGGGGASSWNDLKDKPFGEETVSLGDTMTFPEQTPINPSDVFVQYGEAEGIKAGGLRVSDNVPSIDDFIGGTLTSTQGGTVESAEISEDFILNAVDVFAIVDGTTPLVCVARVDNATVRFQGFDFMFAKKGIYVTCFRYEQAGFNFFLVRSVTLPNYTFTKTVVRDIDPKYLPKGGFGYIEEDTTIFPETVLRGAPDTPKVYLFPSDFKIEVGEAYDVTIDGVTTTCVAKVLNPNQTPTTIILGNARVFTTNFGYEDTGEDFCIADRFLTLEQNVLVSSTKSYPETVTVSVNHGVGKVHKIDEKFLPDTVATKADIFGAMEASY